MRSKTPLLLLEVTVLLLVFAVAAVLCLQAFAGAHLESVENSRRDAALIALQNAAEKVKMQGCYTETVTSSEDGLEVRITPVESGVFGLGKAHVAVYDEAECLTETLVCWQRAVSIHDKDN